MMIGRVFLEKIKLELKILGILRILQRTFENFVC